MLEQDTLDEIAQCVEVLLSTTEGQRLEVPDYGIPDPTFSVDLPLREIETKIADWEPRAAALLSEDESIEELVRALKVQVGEG